MFRQEVSEFMNEMTKGNLEKMIKLNENKIIRNNKYGPFALINRKSATESEQLVQQKHAIRVFFDYIGKVSKGDSLVG